MKKRSMFCKTIAIALLAFMLFAVPCASANAAGLLKIGSTGSEVRAMQQRLIGEGYLPPDGADGVFGPATRAALVAFQRDNGLAADGVYGPKTAAVLEKDRSETNSGKPVITVSKPLRFGSSGQQVEELQQMLILRGYLDDEADGIFGRKTQTALVAFQRDCGLTPDGIYGTQTATALGGIEACRQEMPEDILWLARIIYAEARGESYTGQLAVGNVVMNRVKNASFPDSVYGVIFDGYQFTPVLNGTIYNTPSVSCVRAAWAAYNGGQAVGDCLYFVATSVTDSWVNKNRQFAVNIGGHNFFL